MIYSASSAIQGLACFVVFLLQLLYILISKAYLPTWEGYLFLINRFFENIISLGFDFHNAIEGWGIFFRLGLPGIFMLCAAEWGFEIGNFLAGYLFYVAFSD